MYEHDIRLIVRTGTDEEARNRLRAFRSGWTYGVNGHEIQSETLSRATWYNLGWRCGRVFGPVEPAKQQGLFEILADLQVAVWLDDVADE